MKATREQCLAMAKEVYGEFKVGERQAQDIEAFAHKVQQFTLDQLRAQGAVAWKDTCGTSYPDGSKEYDPLLFGYDGWENLQDGTDLFRIPETLE